MNWSAIRTSEQRNIDVNKWRVFLDILRFGSPRAAVPLANRAAAMAFGCLVFIVFYLGCTGVERLVELVVIVFFGEVYLRYLSL